MRLCTSFPDSVLELIQRTQKLNLQAQTIVGHIMSATDEKTRDHWIREWEIRKRLKWEERAKEAS